MKKNRYDEIVELFQNTIKSAESTKNYLIMKITLFSIIESLKQEYFNYKNQDDAENFEKFICEFSNIDYLHEIDPITTYYELKREVKNDSNDLEYLDDAYNYNAKQILALNGSKEIIDRAKVNKIKTCRHTYARLIYKYRSKLVHEFKALGINAISLETKEDINYISVGSEKIWQLNIPYVFLKKLTNECIYNYIEKCKVNKIDPYENSIEYLFWYEKRG